MRFKDQVVVITGVSSGIGAAAARRFTEEGARTVLTARNMERLESLAANLGGGPVMRRLDVTVQGMCKM
ncbi:SDR family NAD(P)-dependent oxidoreductase [Paenibacillus sp. CMAA1739]|uniref:SDR family oxidoreductase n=1 Tax=Paenibacillus ottowii TaxID=2315729 RepID=UPI00273121FE|nr:MULTISPECIES: SDR family NAD(P)-dependent oxidoreductase [Paenibacillus]MDP1509389.1 SDR family NAD(P)-dependent oxidoreductase [Paenibacillus ottowii]MEC4564485.1 SDR family NAD(P)-dependent oxidoreductase [Paenibacillus sp. CMAA1739]